MVGGSAASLTCVLLAAAMVRAQDAVDPAARVAALADATQRADAHRDLVALGGKAVPALIDGLRAKDETAVAEVAAILQEIGPDAGKAVPALKSRIETKSATLPALRALVELVPYRDADVTLGDRWLSSVLLRLHQLGDNDAEAMVLNARLVARAAFAVDLDVAALMHIAQARDAYRAELAIELLARRGPAAATAVGDLAALLQQPDPRILLTNQTVPIRARAARTILALEPDAPAAATARAVLAGNPPPPPALPPVPERARTRAAQVAAELAQPETRDAAVANLVALGRIAVPPLIAALGAPNDEAFTAAALDVLRALGPAAVDAVPVLAEMLVKLPATEAVVILRALAATVPWSRDVLLLYCTGSLGEISILGHHLQGPIGVDLQNEIYAALTELSECKDIDPSSTADTLRTLLADPSVLKREAALRIVRARGPELRNLVPDLASMLEQPQPQLHTFRLLAGGGVSRSSEPRDDVVQRLAAEAVLAVAARDDPLVAKARAVLASTPSDRK